MIPKGGTLKPTRPQITRRARELHEQECGPACPYPPTGPWYQYAKLDLIARAESRVKAFGA